uniref:RRM domain-containing protein n=1 Tax=Strigamia maritima TaxID=126957 RepID=T1IVZ2_STRMM
MPSTNKYSGGFKKYLLNNYDADIADAVTDTEHINENCHLKREENCDLVNLDHNHQETSMNYNENLDLDRNNKNTDVELGSIKARIHELERESAKLTKLQAKIENQRDQKTERNSRSIFIGNISFKATTEDLRRHFVGCGTIILVTIVSNKVTGYSRGFAYMEFADVDSVSLALALDGSICLKRTIRVQAKGTYVINSPLKSRKRKFEDYKSANIQSRDREYKFQRLSSNSSPRDPEFEYSTSNIPSGDRDYRFDHSRSSPDTPSRDRSYKFGKSSNISLRDGNFGSRGSRSGLSSRYSKRLLPYPKKVLTKY